MAAPHSDPTPMSTSTPAREWWSSNWNWPASTPAQIDLEVDEGVLRVSGMRADTKHPDAAYQQMEISYGRFERLVSLPPEVDVGGASAEYTNGFLEIVLPLRRRSGRKRIAINMTDECSSPDEDGQPDKEGGRQR